MSSWIGNHPITESVWYTFMCKQWLWYWHQISDNAVKNDWNRCQWHFSPLPESMVCLYWLSDLWCSELSDVIYQSSDGKYSCPCPCTLTVLNSVVLLHYVFFRSLDILLGKVKRNSPIPLWNYFILRFQIFVLYFFAGLKKLDKEWLDGHSMRNLGNHWIFDPFK